jgi:hypothetical protein
MQAGNRQKNFVLLIASGLIAALVGCGQINYKRGASAGDFQQDKKTCSEGYNTEAEVEKCLEKGGWLVVGFDKPLTSSKANAAAETSENTTAAGEASTAEVTPAKAEDPLDKIVVSSWWKVGAGPDALLASGDECVAELGNEHQPEGNMSLVTRSLISCMKDKGWFALQH